MSIDYARIHNTIANLIEQFGQPYTLKSQTQGTYVTTTGQNTTTTASNTVNCVDDTGAAYNRSTGTELDSDDFIQHNEKFLLMDTSLIINLNDSVLFPDGREFSIVAVYPVAPGGVILYQRVRVRL